MAKTRTGNLAQEAYVRLRRRIIQQKIRPGEFLNERALMAELGIGLTPLRQAILLLKNENFVESEPHRSAYVKDFSLAEIKELIEALVLLEKKVTELAIARITPVELTAVRNLLDGMEAVQGELPGSDDPERVYWRITELNDRFHRAIAKAARNRFLYRAYDNVRLQVERLSYLMVRQELNGPAAPDGSPVKSARFHREILTCLENGHPDQLGEVITAHVQHLQALITHSLLDIAYE